MPGTRGQRFNKSMSASVPAPIANVTTFVLPASSAPTMPHTWRAGPFAVTEKPKSFGTWLSSTVNAMPFMRQNSSNFRVFGPDENSSNKLDAIYEVSKKLWLADYRPEDADGGELSTDGRVLEMLSEHTLEGWLEGYLLTGRHGFFSTYEAFVHVIDSMRSPHQPNAPQSRF